jgi:hypothetical protein
MLYYQASWGKEKMTMSNVDVSELETTLDDFKWLADYLSAFQDAAAKPEVVMIADKNTASSLDEFLFGE